MAEKNVKKSEPKAESTNGGSGNGGKRNKKSREFFEEMVKKPNARIMLADTGDTYSFHDLIVAVNFAVKRGRDQAGRRLDMDEFKRLMKNVDEGALNWEAAIAELMKATGSTYKRSKRLSEIGEQFPTYRPLQEPAQMAE